MGFRYAITYGTMKPEIANKSVEDWKKEFDKHREEAKKHGARAAPYPNFTTNTGWTQTPGLSPSGCT